MARQRLVAHQDYQRLCIKTTGIAMGTDCSHMRAAEMADRNIYLHWIDHSNSEGYLQP